MKLYDVPCESYVRLLEDGLVPLAAKPLRRNDVIMFHHVDGMYSYCHDLDHRTVHLAAWAEVEVVDPEVVKTLTA